MDVAGGRGEKELGRAGGGSWREREVEVILREAYRYTQQ